MKEAKGALDLKNDDYVRQVGTWKIIQRLEEQVKDLEQAKRELENENIAILADLKHQNQWRNTLEQANAKLSEDLRLTDVTLKGVRGLNEMYTTRIDELCALNAKLEGEKDQLFEIWQRNDWNLRQENAKLKAEIDSLKLQQLVKTEEKV